MSEMADLEDVRLVTHFAGLSEEALKSLASEVSILSYGPRELIIVEGSPPKGFYAVRSGRGRIFRTGPDGREQSLRIVQAGDTFGEVPVFDRGPNPASVETLSDCEVVFVPSQVLLKALTTYPELAVTFLLHFARRLRGFTSLIEQLSLQTVDSRLARYIYQLAREEGIETPEGIVVPRVITLQDLASLVGSVREVVSRTLKVMEEDGVVEIRRKEIVVRDIAALQKRV